MQRAQLTYDELNALEVWQRMSPITLDEMLTVGTKKVMVDVPAVDAEGKPVLDADGNPTYVQEEQTVPDRKIDAKFSLFRGATAYHALSASTTKTGEASYYDPMVKTDNTLYLAAARPADFFGVRVYDRALTISELPTPKLSLFHC